MKHYLTTYGTPELPSSWVMVKMLTTGQLNRFCANLQPCRCRTDIAASLGLNEAVLSSWLETYVRVRDVCAPHGRLWNVGFSIYPAIPADRSVPWLEAREMLDEDPDPRKRLYPVLASLQSVLGTVSARSPWARRPITFIEGNFEVPARALGLSGGWADDHLWWTHTAA